MLKSLEVIAGGAGAGCFRGSPGVEVVYGPRKDPMTVVVSCDGQVNPARGVRGGHSGPPAATYKIKADGSEEKLPGVVECVLQPGEWIRGLDAGGGGYGDPLQRDPDRVLRDVIDAWETLERAREVYGVIFSGSLEDDSLAVDPAATAQFRQQKLAAGATS